MKHHFQSAGTVTKTIATAAFLVVAVPALALTFKGSMQRMSADVHTAKALTSDFDADAALAVLRRYADDARIARGLSDAAGGSKGRDMSSRFDRLAAIADAASRQRPDQASFRKAFLGIAAECKSCHSVYK